MHDTITAPRELAFRIADGIEVSLLWYGDSGALSVTVVDLRGGPAFALPVGDENPLDVFHHPYWHAAQRSLDVAAVAA